MTQMVVTNLRMEQPDWLQIKAMAGETGMSVNKYINNLIRKLSTLEMVGMTEEKKMTIWDLPKLANKKNKPMGMSKEDEIIYG